MAADREPAKTFLTQRFEVYHTVRRGSQKIVVWHRSDGDKTAARGSVRVLTAATHVEQQLQVDRAQAALQHAHPVALLYRHDGASDIDRNDDVAGDRVSNGFAAHEIRSSSSSAWEPMTEPLPHGVHLFGLGTHALGPPSFVRKAIIRCNTSVNSD